MSVEKLITENLELWTGAVTLKSASGRGSSSKRELTGMKKLRELILELAVRGKLVPQDSSEGSTCSLLEGLGAKVWGYSDSEEGPPYQLPENWSWTRLGEFSSINGGFAFKSSKYQSEGVRVVRISDFDEDGLKSVDAVRYENSDDLERFSLEAKNILMAMTGGTVGKACLVDFLPEPMVVNQRVATIKLPDEVSANYVYGLLKTNAVQNVIETAKNSTNDNISMRDIKNFWVPMPPLAEQHRIVQKVDELMALCDQLEQQTGDQIEAHERLLDTLLDTLTRAANATELAENWARVQQHFDTLFTTEHSIDRLKQTILQLAVMGRLVPPQPGDESPRELLERIALKKQDAIQNGLLRREKALPALDESDRPFELPAHWAFARLEDVTDIQSGLAKGKKNAGKQVVELPYLRVANVQRGGLDLSEIKTLPVAEGEVEKYTVRERDLLITEGGDWDKVGRSAIWDGSVEGMVHQNHVFRARLFLPEQNEHWLEKYLNSPIAREYFAGSSKQTTNLASINKTQLRGCLVPVPPAAEQSRIIARLDELMAMCDRLTANLSDANRTHAHLADAVVGQAVN